MSLAVSLLLAAASPAAPPARQTITYTLHKFQQPIGTERSIVVREGDGTERIRTVFTFTDRTTPVPLAAELELSADGSARRFAVWGSTSRIARVDDRVDVAGGRITVEQEGRSREAKAPASFFVSTAYAPVMVTDRLWRYWSGHGRPADIPLFPNGHATIEPRGRDEVKDGEGHPLSLERYALLGRSWGRETLWIDPSGALAAFKGVDTEFDHFEAVRPDLLEALPALVASAAADGVAALRETLPPAPAEAGPVAWEGATLVDGTGAAPVEDAVVVVENGRFAAVGRRGAVAVPPSARRVDVKGRTIVPGLWDMHAHYEQVEWGPVYLAAGVTTVRDCGNEMSFIRSVRDTVEAGRGLGPHLVLACIVDGDGPGSVGTSRLRRAEEIPALIAGFKEAGCAQVKIYSSLDPRLIALLSKAAHEAGMTVTGHIPIGIGAVHAVEAGMDQINHMQFVARALIPDVDPDTRLVRPALMRGLDTVDPKSPFAQGVIATLKAHGTVIDPTLALDETLWLSHDALAAVEPGLATLPPPLAAVMEGSGGQPDSGAFAQRIFRAHRATLRALHEAGVTIVAGTDQAVPGHSLHREIEIYVEAGGFTPMEALQAATIVPARVMGRDRDYGTVQTGKQADFLVIDGDPLSDIRNLRRIVTTVQGGRPYSPDVLWQMAGFKPPSLSPAR
jgi:hypothetical protein